MLNPLREIFIPEAEENLHILEDAFIALEQEPDDADIINEAFRAIHSIKGGAGLAGFAEIKNFTHVIEDLMDDLRSRVIRLTTGMIDVLLKCMDVLRLMVNNIKHDRPAAEALEYLELMNSVKAFSDSSTEHTIPEEQKLTITSREHAYHIAMEFHPELFKSGMDPLMFLSDLKAAGKLENLQLDVSGFPEPEDFDPETSYLSWDAELRTDRSKEEIEDIFSFVEDESHIEITENGHSDIPLHLNLKKNGENQGDASGPSSVPHVKDENMKLRIVDPAETNESLNVAPGPGVSPESAKQGSDSDEPALNGQSAPSPGASAEEPAPVKTEPALERRSEASTDRRQHNRRASDSQASSYIRVKTEKLEKIFNTVSELVISEAHLNSITDQYEDRIPDDFIGISESLKDITHMLQDQITSLRMMSLSNTFDRFRRVVRDLASEMGKSVSFIIEGQDTELDKNMIEKLNDPIKHIIRNSIDHGLETPEERRKAGKNEEGTLRLSASIEDGKVIIEVSDDGRGINRERVLAKAREKRIIDPNQELSDNELINLIFHPGFSTSGTVTEISGRGVGMDVVRSTIKSLNGDIAVSSPEGQGTSIKLSLPLTMAILDGMLVNIGPEKYIIPTLSILEIFRMSESQPDSISATGEVVRFRGDYIPLIRLNRILNVPGGIDDLSEAELIVITSSGTRAALLVDNVQEQFQVVLKSLQKNYRKVDNISSATIMGDGDVALILDINNLILNHAMRGNVQEISSAI